MGKFALPQELKAGPLTREGADAINRAFRDLYSMIGGLNVAAPMYRRQGYDGILLGVDTSVMQVNGIFEVCGLQFWCCANAVLPSVSTNNWDLPSVGGKPVYTISTSFSAANLTGVVPAQFGGVNGPQLIALTNVGANPITLLNNSGSSLAANRFRLPPTYGSSVTLQQYDAIVLWWDFCQDGCWKVFACTVDIDNLVGENVNAPVNLTAGVTEILCNNDQAGNAFGRIYGSSPGAGVFQLDWQGVLGYVNGGGVTGPEPNIELTQGANVVITLGLDGPRAALNWTVAVDTTSSVSWTGPFEICGYLFWCCANATLTSASNNIDNLDLPSAGHKVVYDLTATTPLDVTGIIPGLFGGSTGPQLIALTNVGTNAITLKHNNTASAATNRFLLPPTYQPNGVALQQYDSCILWWDFCTDHKWKMLACTVDIDSGGGYSLTGENKFTPFNVTANVNEILCDNDQGNASFGRIYGSSPGAGIFQLDWQGLLGYLTGTGFVGPEPNVELTAGAGITLTLVDDGARQAVNFTIATNLAAENLTPPHDELTRPLLLLQAQNDMLAHAFGRIHVTNAGAGTSKIDWQGFRLYTVAQDYTGPEPDLEFIAGYGIGISIFDNVAAKRTQATIGVSLTCDSGGGTPVYNTTTSYADVTALSATASKTALYLICADVHGTMLTTNPGDYVQVRLAKNGAAFGDTNNTYLLMAQASGVEAVGNCTWTMKQRLTIGDVVTIQAQQGTGGAGTIYEGSITMLIIAP